MIGWTPPNTLSESASKQIQSYQVIVDGQVQSTVNGSEKVLKATVTGFDTSRIHRVSVKSLGGPGGKKMSNEAACTMVIGKDAPLGPTGKDPMLGCHEFPNFKIALLFSFRSQANQDNKHFLHSVLDPLKHQFHALYLCQQC